MSEVTISVRETGMRVRKNNTRRPCNTTKATQPAEKQQSSRTNAAQIRVKKEKKEDGDKRVNLASMKNRTKTTTTTQQLTKSKAVIAMVNREKSTKDTKANNWKVGPTTSQQPSSRVQQATNEPSQATRRAISTRTSRPSRPVLKTTTTTTTTTAAAIKIKQEQPEVKKEAEVVPLSAPSSTKVVSDPQLCEEYAEDIIAYLLTMERDEAYLVKEGFLDHQCEMQPYHRTVLVDWLVQVQGRFSMLPETLYICVDILDRYLQVTPVKKAHLQLVGVSALFMAAKYEEIYPPSIMEMTYISADTYTAAQVRETEIKVLRALNYLINKPMALTFLRRYSKIKRASLYVHNLAKYIIESSFLSERNSSILPSHKAAAALLIAGSLLTPEHTISFTGEHSARELHKAKTLLLESFKKWHNHRRFSTIREKFSSSHFHKVAKLTQLKELC